MFRRRKTTRSLAVPNRWLPAAPTNVQFMIKDEKIRLDRRLEVRAIQRRQTSRRSCAPYLLSCHETTNDRDFVFTPYAP